MGESKHFSAFVSQIIVQAHVLSCNLFFKIFSSDSEPSPRGFQVWEATGSNDSMSSKRRQRSAIVAIFLLMMPLMLTSVSSTVATSFEENESGNTPEGIWSDDYANHVHPWGGTIVFNSSSITIMTACDSECSNSQNNPTPIKVRMLISCPSMKD